MASEMTLESLLTSLTTKGVKVTLFDSEGEEIIKFFSDGYAGIESDILARAIKKFDMPSNNTLNIYLKNAPEPTPEPETNSDTETTTTS